MTLREGQGETSIPAERVRCNCVILQVSIQRFHMADLTGKVSKELVRPEVWPAIHAWAMGNILAETLPRLQAHPGGIDLSDQGTRGLLSSCLLSKSVLKYSISGRAD